MAQRARTQRETASQQRRRSRVPLRWLLPVVALLSVGVGYGAVLLDVYRVAQLDASGPADAAVVLGAAQWNGAPSPVFRARLDHAAALWRDGRVRWILVTGGTAAGDELSEATVGRAYLRGRGIPADVVLSVPVGSSTLASLQAAAGRLRALQADDALLVSDPYHMKRSLRMARDTGIAAQPSPVRDGPFANAPLAVLRQSAREAAGFLIYLATGL
jgi:vancomycin permeability regulator SanA